LAKTSYISCAKNKKLSSSKKNPLLDENIFKQLDALSESKRDILSKYPFLAVTMRLSQFFIFQVSRGVTSAVYYRIVKTYRFYFHFVEVISKFGNIPISA
jgi:hypothetical protein